MDKQAQRDAIERAIKALEKQVPQKVKKYKGLNETACPECGANNDPGEPCDCAREEPGRECLEEGQDEKK